jgi:ATP-dependent Clp protease ATP-binding subunit ClpA
VLLVWLPGVGKTELAKALAAYLFNSDEALVGGWWLGVS